MNAGIFLISFLHDLFHNTNIILFTTELQLSPYLSVNFRRFLSLPVKFCRQVFLGKSASRSKPSAHRHSSLKFCTYTHAPFFSWQFKFWPILSYQLDSSRPSFVNKYIQTSMFFLWKFPNTWPCLFLTQKLHFLVHFFPWHSFL